MCPLGVFGPKSPIVVSCHYCPKQLPRIKLLLKETLVSSNSRPLRRTIMRRRCQRVTGLKIQNGTCDGALQLKAGNMVEKGSQCQGRQFYGTSR